MKRLVSVLVVLSLALGAHAQQNFQWPKNKKGAIVLTYDDALVSHLDIAVPQLNKYKLKGSFYLDGGMTEAEMDRWSEVSAQGHELGNHTLYHPCSEKALRLHPRNTSESHDAHSILEEIGMMNRLLYGIDGKKTRTYAYPCTEVVVGGVDYADTLRQSRLITYARVGGDENAVVTDLNSLDPLKVPSYALLNNQDADALISFVKKVQQEGGIGVLMFHGVGGDYLTVSAEDHEKLLQYLAAHKDEIWVGTFQEVMDHVVSKKQVSK